MQAKFSLPLIAFAALAHQAYAWRMPLPTKSAIASIIDMLDAQAAYGVALANR